MAGGGLPQSPHPVDMARACRFDNGQRLVKATSITYDYYKELSLSEKNTVQLVPQETPPLVPQPAPDERAPMTTDAPATTDAHTDASAYDQLLLFQLPPSEQQSARTHYERLTASLQTGNTTALKRWLATRIAVSDISSQRCAALKDALLTKDLSRSSVRSARDLDALAASSHRRMMDFLEAYMRLERGDAKPVVKIQNAEHVAVVAGDAVHTKEK